MCVTVAILAQDPSLESRLIFRKPMASGSVGDAGDSPGKRYLLGTIRLLKEDVIPAMKPPDTHVYEAGDIAKLEKAVQQTEDWLNKNPHASQRKFYRQERKLWKFSDYIVWDCAK